MFGAAGKYSIGPAKIFLGYLGGKDRTGAIDNGFMNQSAASITPPATAPSQRAQ